MRVFAFEYFSGGGLAGQPLPPSLARQGDMMLTTLVGELGEVPGVEVIASRDPRLPPVPGCQTLRPSPGEDPADLYARGLAAADAAWPTAPEGGGTLERLAVQTVAAGRILLGCRPEAVRVAASKRATVRALASRGIPVVPTFTRGEPLPPGGGLWVVKPDDGAGCDGLELLPDRVAALGRLEADQGWRVAQPWIEGEALSLSLLCGGGDILVLSCNRQRIRRHQGRVELEALRVNDPADHDSELARLAGPIAGAIPGLWGYVGVDLILGSDGPVVLEVNPRLTTSYCGLPEAIGRNTAALVLELQRRGQVPTALRSPGRSVTATIRLEPSHAA